jgi:nucleotide-binding universal stress UspA family protein
MPFMKCADQVVVALVDEDGSPTELGIEPAADIARHLDRHRAPLEVRHLPKWDRAADALLNEAKMIGADLIVVGGYGHSRLREWLLGGTTRDLLTDSRVPLLVAH